MELHIAPDTKELSSRLAGFLLEDILSVLDKKDRYTFVLSGGSTPKALYKLLASEPYRSSVAWEKVHFFWGDERFVPFEDPRNNANMAYEELLNHIPVVAENIHVMNTSLSPEDSSEHYTGILRSYFGDTGPTFDFVLLGMGDDGHTLSLFPGMPIIHEREKWVDSFYLDAQSMYRITLTAPVVNRAEKVVFLAAGSNKAEVLYQVLKGERNPEQYPSQVIQPSYGELHWFVDAEAAASI